MLFTRSILACALLPRDGAAQSGLGPLVSIISKESLTTVAMGPSDRGTASAKTLLPG